VSKAPATQSTSARSGSERPPVELVDGLVDVARRAGRAIDDVYRRFQAEADAGVAGVTYKADDSPLTAADLASHEVIAAGLRDLAPELPILSEEGAERPYASRRGWRRFWLVDPLDGTKEFIKRNGEFTVNVALVADGEPILGVVHAPVLGRTYLGAIGEGAWRQDGDGPRRSIRAAGTGEETLAVVASRSHAGGELAAYLEKLPPHRLVSMGSSLKICLVAEGAADLYPRIGPTMEWDTAAAHAVVAAAGGRLVDLDGEPLRYNKENLLNPYFLVLGERDVPLPP